MKVYELMDLLSGCSAGAEVKYCDLVTVDEVKSHPGTEDAGEMHYSMEGTIKEVFDEDGVVRLYA